MSLHKRSLELLDRFLAETPEAELNKLFSKYENLNITGTTFDEYLSSFEDEFDILEWHCELPMVDFVTFDSILSPYLLLGVDSCYTSPPIQNKILNKKGSVEFTESFFLV